MNPGNSRAFAVVLGALLVIGVAQTQEMDHEAMGHQNMDHSGHHNMTQEEYDLLREKVLPYRYYTNEQIMDNMMRMPPTHERYISDPALKGRSRNHRAHPRRL